LEGERGVSCTTIGGVIALVSLAGAFVAIIIASAAGPAVKRSREATRRDTCLENERQICSALSMYAHDHGGRLPAADHWVDRITQYALRGSGYPPYGPAPYRQPYATPALDEMMTCPAVTAPARPRTYALNEQLGGWLAASIAQPASTVQLFETAAVADSPADDGSSLATPGRHPDGKTRGNNYGFADGHVKWLADGPGPTFEPRTLATGPSPQTP
jgi:prepilin-type processing-associated H-X9-DG protein